MNIEEYISSGILELYAAGALSAAEQAEVEMNALKYPEIKAELDLIIEAYDQYASLHAITPPARLKEKVLNAVSRQTQVNNGFPEANKNNNPAAAAKIIPMPTDNPLESARNYKWLFAASVALLVLSNVFSIYFYRNWKSSDKQLQLAVANQQQYAQRVQQVQQKLTQNEEALALISDPGTQRIDLKGVEKSPDSRVTVFWQKATSEVLLSVNNLPQPAENQQYQLWAIVGGKPVDAGLLATNQQTEVFQQMKAVSQAQAFAITLEPKGGSAAPTLDQMYVMGAI